MFIVRFDLRGPLDDGPARTARHRAAVDMARFADEHGAAGVVVSEHHTADDGYLPSPFVLAGAMAAATERTPIVVAVTLLPLHDPVRLAEDIVTLDHLSGGRALIVLGLGYRPVEYELYGQPFAERGRLADEKLARLLTLLDDAVEGHRPVRVTPAPRTPPRSMLAWGGGSVPAARRAGRFGIGLFAQTDAPGLGAAYEEAARAAGHEPGLCVLPSPDAPYAAFVADDVDAAWDELGPSLLADATAYRRWNDEQPRATRTASISEAETVADLRATPAAHRVVDRAGAADLVARHGLLTLHPLCGGIDPAVAWPYLERAVEVAGTR